MMADATVTLFRLDKSFVANGRVFSRLMVDVVASPSFRYAARSP